MFSQQRRYSLEANLLRFTRIEFNNFKAFKRFSISLKHFNVLVGPNNAGKSTVLAAFRVLSAALRRANSRKPLPVGGNLGFGYTVDLSSTSVAEENIFYNYMETDNCQVVFTLSNGNKLRLHFPEQGVCYLFAESDKGRPSGPANFRSRFNCKIGFVPILGPVEHRERLVEPEAARMALYNYQAARNFRNIWFRYPEKFDQFRRTLQETWQGMDIEPPIVDYSHEKPELYMFCPEGRLPREVFWSGFGFQVWCQMLTHLIQSSEVSIFLIDEPDIYLHSELQRQLLGLLRNLGPDILIATHSTEIISEAETDEIVLVNKERTSGRRLKSPAQLTEVFSALGSNTNPVLTQLAKTRKALFVEGKDFQIMGKFARILKAKEVANRTNFAVIPIGGFSPDRVRSLKNGIEATIGGEIQSVTVLDRDYRSASECESILRECQNFCKQVQILGKKEIENFLLVPPAMERALMKKISDRIKLGGVEIEYEGDLESILSRLTKEHKRHFTAQYLDNYRRFRRAEDPKIHDTTITQEALEQIDLIWTEETCLSAAPGKELLSELNREIQQKYGASLTPAAIINSMKIEEVPDEITSIISILSDF